MPCNIFLKVLIKEAKVFYEARNNKAGCELDQLALIITYMSSQKNSNAINLQYERHRLTAPLIKIDYLDLVHIPVARKFSFFVGGQSLEFPANPPLGLKCGHTYI